MELLLKFVLAPALIGGVSLAGRRCGPRLEGILVGFPLTSAPVACVLAIEQGPAFGARFAESALRSATALAAFTAAYARTSSRAGWLVCSIAGWTAFVAAGVLVRGVSWSVTVTATLVVGAIAVAWLCIPRACGSPVAAALPRWDVATRMAVATAMLLLVTGAAAATGPQWSGLLSSAPVCASVVVAFAHLHGGAAAAAQALRGLCAGLLSFAAFFAVAAAGLGNWCLLPTMSAAALASIAAQWAVVFVRCRCATGRHVSREST